MKNNKGIQSQDFSGLINQEVLIITQAVQLNLLGQVFRPIFCGTVSEVGIGHLTLTPVTVKMVNAPFYKFPTPISIPLEKIVSFSTEVPCDLVFPLT
ncbi:hypothetical protein CSV69_00640 [Sporosarcina sp. P26b]|uniref:hypothetical protein n=1 Tax=unclassified Sporosarcina TaxID=2647733 RepID=UPI000C162E4C|nr:MULTISPECIES: hypothetical protein [unclassified Sporosarcina]PIC97459.1 hypothetical protein CSV69_00640 [Sporosarcina sp. P26b]PID00895.1 hypothetical protein CSV68_01340 [Sporosarcina sp. P29]PID07047.1 hypothetical protein CSV66_00230 [Sporosarcina sp. P30]PID10243.1 hypothetical protein CSV65_00235 [Sporosarcina sp. P31]PID12141.1 hypothetical protein CSV64_08230 [Sporosarcina sp. P32b]